MFPAEALDAQSDGTSTTSVALWLRCPCCRRRLVDLSGKFTAQATLQRMCIWADIGLAWGPIMPFISLAALMCVHVEEWCHGIARTQLDLGRDARNDAEAHMPRRFMVIGIAVSQALMALHVASAATEELNLTTLCLASVALALAWVISVAAVWQQEKRKTQPEVGVTSATIELPQTFTVPEPGVGVSSARVSSPDSCQ